jgi:hypothetical protein
MEKSEVQEMSFLQQALYLAEMGFHVFPIAPNKKSPPTIQDFPNQSSQNKDQINKWWIDPVLGTVKPYNIGISTSKYKEDEALLVLDIDNKNGKRGDDELIKLQSQGYKLPETFEQRTPSGGRHLVYRVSKPVKQGSNVLAEGLDIRSSGGFIVACGSRVEGGKYEAIEREIVSAPGWLIERCGNVTVRSSNASKTLDGVNPKRATERATHYLKVEAVLSVQDNGGDQTAFQVAARVKDFGVDKLTCLELMLDHWNPRCAPPWSPEELNTKVENAYSYGALPVGVSDPGTEFKPVPEDTSSLHPFDVLNREYAYVLGEGNDFIIYETVDHKGHFCKKHLDILTFQRSIAHRTMNFEGKTVPVSGLWLKSDRRRSYNGICFSPGKEVPSKFYNTWRGFSVKPSSHGNTAALDAFLLHAHKNACNGDDKLYKYLIAYFAQLIQIPHEKPLVALVFKGGKGVGKNALIECVGHLLGDSFAVVSNRRHLVGNFNSVLENKLLLTLDEAFWSGDKEADGILKHLITGKEHMIERKGKEPYKVDNCLRLAILGNEDWLVPASDGERRYAVFNVGDGNKQDIKFFTDMRVGMERGGYALLLNYLLNYKYSINVSVAPITQGLVDQMEQTTSLTIKWWKECLSAAEILGGDFDGWPTTIHKERFRSAMARYLKSQNIQSRMPDVAKITRDIRNYCPSFSPGRESTGDRRYVFNLPPLDVARREYAEKMKFKMEWEPEEDILT